MSSRPAPPSKPKSPNPNAPPPEADAASPKDAKAKEKKDKKKNKEEEDDDDDHHDDTEKGAEKEDPAGVAEADQLKSEIDPILKSGAVVKALQTAIEAKGKTRELLKMQETLALSAMDSIKADDIAKFVDAASDETLDILMRIVYAGMATGKNCPNLLIWHGKVSDKAGIGVIMRAMCRPGQ